MLIRKEPVSLQFAVERCEIYVLCHMTIIIWLRMHYVLIFCSICILYYTKCLNCYICLQVSEGIDFSDDNARVVVSFFLFKFSGPRVLLFNLHNFGLGL